MHPDNLQKLLDINTKQFDSIDNNFKKVFNAIEVLVDGGKELMSTDLKQKDQITALQKQVEALESLLKIHMKSH